MADPTRSGNTGEGGWPETERLFGYTSFYHGKKITLKELYERLRAITETSCGMAAVMEKIIASPDMDSETAGIARLIHAGATEILLHANHLGPEEGSRVPMHGDAA